jgi:hypothetical protein
MSVLAAGGGCLRASDAGDTLESLALVDSIYETAFPRR